MEEEKEEENGEGSVGQWKQRRDWAGGLGQINTSLKTF